MLHNMENKSHIQYLKRITVDITQLFPCKRVTTAQSNGSPMPRCAALAQLILDLKKRPENKINT